METYYHRGDLAKFAEVGKGNKELWEKFQSYYAAVFAEGALTEREKALIALAVAHHVRDFDTVRLGERRIATCNHCYGCTAGPGSSCGGSIT